MTKRKTSCVTFSEFTIDAGDITITGGPNEWAGALCAGEGETIDMTGSFTVEMTDCVFRVGAAFLMEAWQMAMPWLPREGEA